MGSLPENTTTTETPDPVMGNSSSRPDNRSASFVDESTGTRFSVFSIHTPSAIVTAILCLITIVSILVVLGCCLKLALSNITRYQRMRQQSSAANAMRNLEARSNAEQVSRLLNTGSTPVTVVPASSTAMQTFRSGGALAEAI